MSDVEARVGKKVSTKNKSWNNSVAATTLSRLDQNTNHIKMMVDMSDLMNYHGTMLNNFNHGQHSRDILLLCGDIESNPGPTGRRSVAQGPSLEEQVTKKFMSVGMISSLQQNSFRLYEVSMATQKF